MAADLVSHHCFLFCAAHGVVLFVAVLLIVVQLTIHPPPCFSNHSMQGQNWGCGSCHGFGGCSGLAVFVAAEMASLCRRCYAWLIVAFVCYVLLLVIWMWRFLQLSWLRVKSSTVDQCRYDSFFAFKMVYLYLCNSFSVVFIYCSY